MTTKRMTRTQALQEENDRLRQRLEQYKQRETALADAIFGLIQDHVDDLITDRR